jgi:hypothetical protein
MNLGRTIVAVCVLLAGCARDGVAAEGISPSAVASRGVACSPAPVVTPSEGRTPGWGSGEQVLYSDHNAIDRYGADHAEEFAGAWLAKETGVRLVAAFTDNLEAHCAALRDIVAHPERLEVVRRDHTVEDRRRIRAEIESQMTPDGPIWGIGDGPDHVSVDMRADGEALAAELWARYGDAVGLRVGTAPYPPPDPPTVATACDIGEIVEWPAGVAATLEVDDDVIASGKDTGGRATIVNDSAERFTADLGETEVGYVFEEGGTTPVGVYTRGMAGPVGVGADLAPGEQISVNVVVGTASCDISRGYALPPGTYDVRAVFPATYEDTGQIVPGPTWLSQPARLRVVEGTDS